jgi:hypothetical protein
LKKDCEAFYNELKEKRPGGYADTNEKLTNLIGDKDTDGSLKKNIETFLRGNINEKGGFLEVNDLVQRFREVSSEGDLKVEQFEGLLKTYEANSDEGKLKTEIKNLFETKWIGELRENKCRNIDTKRDLLIKHIEAFAKGDYGFPGVARMDWGDYYTDYATDGETTDKVENAEWTAFEQLKEEFRDAFLNGDGTDFKSLLAGVRGKNNTVNRLKALVKDAATAQTEKIKNEKPTSEEVAQKDKFLKNLPLYLNKQSYEDSMNTRETRVMGYFNETLQGFEKTREKLESLLDARKEESDFSVFNRLEHMLEEVKEDEGWWISDDKETTLEAVSTERTPSTQSYV